MKAYVDVSGFRFPVAPRVGWAIFAAAPSLMAGHLWRRSGSGGRRQSMSYHLRLAYTPNGMARVEIEKSVSRSRFDLMDVGDRVTICSSPSQPRVFEVEPGEAAGAARFQWWLAFGSTLGALGLAIWAQRQWGKTVPEAEA